MMTRRPIHHPTVKDSRDETPDRLDSSMDGGMMSGQSQTILGLKGVSKSFPGVKALVGIDLEIQRGEIHAIMGENGAGKSTLMNILSGVYHPDDGQIFLDGQVVRFRDTRDAQLQGIAMIHQELSLMPHLSVAENIYMGRLPCNRLGLVDSGQLYRLAEAALQRVGACDFGPDSVTGDLSTSQMQLVEIAKALSLDARILIMDEPTSSLTAQETEILLDIMKVLADGGVSVLFISHRIDEVFRVAHRLTVLRDGAHIATKDKASISHDEIVALMVGRAFSKAFHRSHPAPETGRTPMLEVRHLSGGKAVKDVSFSVHAGEILALTGLVGAGRTETVEMIFGARGWDGGEILVDGHAVRFGHPCEAIRAGMGLVPEGRKIQGILPERSVRENMTMARLNAVLRRPFIDTRQDRKTAEQYRDLLGVRTPSIEQKIKLLSGGNQQKAIFCRWLMTKPRLLFLDEPTHGIDIGAKAEIYQIINDLAKEGVAIVLISSELPEVLTLADRIIVMNEGRVSAEMSHQEASQELIMQHAVNRSA